MNRCLLLNLIVGLFFAVFPSQGLSSRITIDSEDQFTYAVHLMEKGDYERAIGEFERLVYFFPGDEKIPEARYRIGLCYFKNGEYERARKAAHELYGDHPESIIGGKALLLIAESYYVQDVLSEANHYYVLVLEHFGDSDLRDRALYRLGWSRMRTDQWREASRTFKGVEKESPLFPSAKDLSERSLEGEALPYKDPVTAGVMAGVLPGLGHLYCGRPKDGAVSFLLNGLFVWAAYEAFEEDHAVLGGILSFMELGWYSGNIYSAVNCAHKHNRAVRDTYRKNLMDRFDLSPFTSGNKDLGLALKFDF